MTEMLIQRNRSNASGVQMPQIHDQASQVFILMLTYGILGYMEKAFACLELSPRVSAKERKYDGIYIFVLQQHIFQISKECAV